MKNCFIKFPFLFSETKMLKDAMFCFSETFTPHFNPEDYDGVWKSISLRSGTGNANDIYAHSKTGSFIDTVLLSGCTYFRSIIDSFKCEKESIRLLNLGPNSEIKEHSDSGLGYEDGVFRVHIPISTNSKVAFYFANNRVDMKVGESWYGNFNVPHRVENFGATDRIHLVMDCLRNEWSDQLFERVGYDFSEEKKETTYDIKTKKEMIKALQEQDNEAAKQLIYVLQKEIDTLKKDF